ncbi:WD repeat-containing protein 6 [Gnomoniopsis smithogilvyi]|uniref:WD repeat-containing protein 6 n=1 Tax=Gnomoniopsis smithogilvyi TaxID=1191159 RepID=A0A9W8Z3L3_9PEZI|nr:WD repeat-containing protein 6 [Gnomoniopsis smithogilvyi]
MTLHHASPTALQRAHIHCPITALAFYPSPPPSANTSAPYLLSGQDTHLYIHPPTGHHYLASIKVFPAQPIQGINTSASGDVLLWGGPWIALLTRERITQLLSQQQPAVLEETEVLRGTDWIYHASFASSTLAAVVTAHNETFPLHITRAPGTERRLCWGRVRAPPSSRPILYAARLEVLADGEVLVAAGTVFGEIVVWRCRLDEGRETEGDVEVLYVFTGHEGSIFGVDLSPAIIVDGKATRLLASCSDDRTIRVWDISDSTSAWRRLGTGEKNPEKRRLPAARETGFGENAVLDLEAQAGCVSSEPVAMAMGHVSRIWNARFAPPTPPGGLIEGLTMYSFGEDATAQRWRLNISGLGATVSSNGKTEKVNEDLVASLTHEAILHRHSGKHIWSSAILQPTLTHNKMLIATGGSDGKINIVEEIPPEADTRSVMLDISGTEVVRRFPDVAMEIGLAHALPKATKRTKTKAEEEPFLMYALLNAESAIATTSTGRIFNGSLRGSELSWSEIVMPQAIRNDLRQYQIVRSAGTGTGIALLGSTSGSVYLYRDGMIEQVCKLPRKVSDIFTVPVNDFASLDLGNERCPSSLLPIIVSTMGSSQVTLMVLDIVASGPIVHQTYAIELESGFNPTAVGCCGRCLIFGSRNGALMVYRPSHNGEITFERILRVERPFTKDAVSSILPLPPKGNSPAPYFLTTSRDGRYRIYEISTASSIQLHLRHEAVPPLGPMIESAVFTPSTPSKPAELILAGFRSKYFIVWNETRQLELANVECGGAYRSFTHHVDPTDPANIAFVWTRASRTCVYSQTALSQRILKPGGHGREIKAVAASDAAGLLATGAEDTTVRIWSYNADDTLEGEKDLRCLAVIEKHTAGIQCLKWASANYLISGSGNEELYIWRITRLDGSAYEGLAVVCEGVYPDKTRDGDLRIMSFDVEVLPQQEIGDEVLCLSLVLSNSTLRTYRYSKSDGFELLAEGKYTGACLMQIRHLRVAEAGEEVHVLTAATDGHIAIWKTAAAHDTATTAVYEMSELVRLHQSGIKSLDTRSISEHSYVVVTGGDDNALGYVSLWWSSTRSCYTVGSRLLANGAHAAALTGLCITGVDVPPDQTGSIVRVCTASNDQRVKSWRILLGENARATRVKLMQDRYSAVADCGDLEILKGGMYTVVVGVGMEVWDLPS